MRSIPDVTELEELVDYIILELKNGFDVFKTKIELALTTTYGQNRIDEVNLSFDNQVASAQQGLVSRGMYSTTSWTTILAGINKARQYALNELNDKLLTALFHLRPACARSLSGSRSGSKLVHGVVRCEEQEQSHAYGNQEQGISVALDFMESRTDDYPDMSSLVNIRRKPRDTAKAPTVAPHS